MPFEPMVRSPAGPDVPAGEDPTAAAPPPAGELVGQLLRGTYRILELLDEGGMGRLYRAEHVRLHRPIAIKVLARHLAHDQGALTRFHREAEIVSQLHHPHIVHILDFDTTEAGAPYIVMELLQGESLARRVDRERMLPIADIVQIVAQIASALNLAHQQGIVHRDLKPDNVFLLRVDAGQIFIKLLDFGISKSTSTATKVTREFDVLGTPDYMAPEQAISTSRADHRADQFALACMTYEMITGRMPFTADTLPELLRRIVHEVPPAPSTYAPGIGAMVDRVLMRAMAKSPDDRFQTVQDYAFALAQATGISLHSSPPPLTNSLTPQSPPVSDGPVSNPPVLASLPHFDSRSPRRQRSGELSVPTHVNEDEQSLPVPEAATGQDRNHAFAAKRARGSEDSAAPRHPARPMLRSSSGEERPGPTDAPRAAFKSVPDASPSTLRSSGNPPQPTSAQCLASLEAAIGEVRRAVAFGEQQRALTQARRAVHLARGCEEREARAALVEASSLLELVLLRPLGDAQRKVALVNARPSAQGDWTPGHFFLLSQLEQPITLEELLDVSPLSRPETLCFVSDLLSQGVVSVS